MKRALITGITGQDGSYLAEFLLNRSDYEVHGLVRRSSSLNRQRIDHLFKYDSEVRDRLHLHYADLADASSLSTVMEQVRPDEVYNLGARAMFGFHSINRFIRRTWWGWEHLLIGGLTATQSVPTGQVLPGIELGDVWRGAAATGFGHAVSPTKSLCLRQALRSLADDQLSGGLRSLRLLRNPLQSREPTSW